MNYYRLLLSEKVKSKVQIQGLDPDYFRVNCSHKDFERIPKGMVSYYEYSDTLEYTDIIMQPTTLVSNKLKKILCLYDPSIKAKRVVCFPFDRKINATQEFLLLDFSEVDCLSDYAEKNPNGTLKELILNKTKIGSAEVFKVQGTLENYIIVSTSVAESILRRKLCGVSFKKVRLA